MEETIFEPQEIDLRTYWQVVRKRRYTILTSLAAVVTLGMLWTFMQKPVYQAETKILSKGNNATGSGDILSSTIPALGAFADQRAVQTQVEIITSSPMLKEAAKRTGLGDTDIAPQVKVDGGKDSNVINVTTKSTNPKVAMDLANNLAAVYVEGNLNQNRSSAHAGRVFLEDQQARYQTALEEAAVALRDYQQKTGSVSLPTATEAEVKALSDLEVGKMAAETDRNTALARADGIRRMLDRTTVTVVSQSTIARNPIVDKLQGQIVDLNVQRAGLLREFKPASAKVQAVDAQLATAEAREKSVVASILSGKIYAENPVHQALMAQLTDAEGSALASAARSTAVGRSIAAQKAILQRLPEEQFRMAQLERNVQVAEKTYLALQDRYQSLRIAEESTLANAQIIEPARLPKGPISPKRKLNFILSVLVGLMLGVGIAALQEALDDTLRTSEDVERELALPMLGIVTRIAEPGDRSLVHAGTLSGVAEAFRMVRSNIKFMAVDKSLRTIMVTSAGKGEGKSTTAANLAIALAQDGRNVVLVDGDLRRPSVHKQFGVPNATGLTNAIVGGLPTGEVSLDVGLENLRIVTAGPIPPNPAELLDSERFAKIVEELRAAYDIVVFDAPPVLGVADASVLGGRCDGVVLVVAAGEVEKKAARRTVQMLQQARAHILGVVLNKIDQRHGEYYYDYYYYQYHSDDGSTHRRKRNKASSSHGKGK
ncbi:MAG TPA: polysaccharide biosynthesis tyrosine autokinase [Armatimonadota bacterium]|jgi:capsular exopolysaccharide synthesis family protein